LRETPAPTPLHCPKVRRCGFSQRVSARDPTAQLSLVHGIFTPKNILIYQGGQTVCSITGGPRWRSTFDLWVCFDAIVSARINTGGQRTRGPLAMPRPLSCDSFQRDLYPYEWVGCRGEGGPQHWDVCWSRVAGKSRIGVLASARNQKQQHEFLQLIQTLRPAFHHLGSSFVQGTTMPKMNKNSSERENPRTAGSTTVPCHLWFLREEWQASAQSHQDHDRSAEQENEKSDPHSISGLWLPTRSCEYAAANCIRELADLFWRASGHLDIR